MENTSKYNLFIIDDDASIQKSLKRLLDLGGFNIRTFSTAKSFLRIVTPELEGCIILDVRIPDMSGLDLQEYLNKENSLLKIVFVSAYDDLDVCRQAMKAGAVDFLMKPVRGHKLIEAIYQSVYAENV